MNLINPHTPINKARRLMANRPGRQVIACIPYYGCLKYVRRAVDSLLAQTYRNLIIVVLNDADFTAPPWPALADIQDARLVRFDLMQNRGPYFATQVVVAATTSAYLLIQDADDWSHPKRVEHLLYALENDKADLAISAQPQFYECSNGTNQILETRWSIKAHSNWVASLKYGEDRFQLDTRLTAQFRYRSPHHGLFRIETLRDIGGYYGGFRFNYDVLVTNLILMIGKITHVSEPLYHRLVRPNSLTQSPVTGIRSTERRLITEKTTELYNAVYNCYQGFLKGKVTGSKMTGNIRKICETHVTADDLHTIALESERLKQQFHL